MGGKIDFFCFRLWAEKSIFFLWILVRKIEARRVCRWVEVDWRTEVSSRAVHRKDSGREADPYGIHAVTCQRSGAISRAHSLLRGTAAELLAKAGITAAPEQHLPGSLDRPADLLASSWRGRTVALDFTVITPTRAASWGSRASNGDVHFYTNYVSVVLVS